MENLNYNLTERELAARWNMSIKTLQIWRFQGKGPSYLKLGRSVRYPMSVIAEFEKESFTESTSAVEV